MSEIVEREDLGNHVTTLMMNRPEKLNALDDALIERLFERLDECIADDDTRVVVIKGAGRSFCAGADASRAGSSELTAAEWRSMLLDDGWGRFLALWESPKPIVLQVHGHCLGIALMLCNCADIVVAADDAAFGWPTLPFGGGILGPAAVWHLGIHRAKELSFQVGARMTGVEAAAYGFINYSVPADQLEADVRGLATRIAQFPSDLLRIKKDAINQVADGMGFTTAMKLGAAYGSLAHHARGAEEAKALVAELGLKGAVAHYRDTGK